MIVQQQKKSEARSINTRNQCPHQADFFSAIQQFVGARANIFGNTVNIALENLTNLWKNDIWYTLILDWYEI